MHFHTARSKPTTVHCFTLPDGSPLLPDRLARTDSQADGDLRARVWVNPPLGALRKTSMESKQQAVSWG
jgi:hypothetical protein